MAKIKGPLLSQRASGIIGERLVFSQRKSGQQVRFQRSQSDIITSDRIEERAKITIAVAGYQSLDEVTKDIWHGLAVGKHFTGYNLFVRMYLNGDIFASDLSTYGLRNYGLFVYGKS